MTPESWCFLSSVGLVLPADSTHKTSILLGLIVRGVQYENRRNTYLRFRPDDLITLHAILKKVEGLLGALFLPDARNSGVRPWSTLRGLNRQSEIGWKACLSWAVGSRDSARCTAVRLGMADLCADFGVCTVIHDLNVKQQRSAQLARAHPEVLIGH